MLETKLSFPKRESVRIGNPSPTLVPKPTMALMLNIPHVD